jgi:YesN/AraC family two-component response regulator
MRQMSRYIEENYNKPIGMKRLAQKFGFVPSYLSKLFREYKGISPLDYITKLRIERAKVLICESDILLVRDVSRLVGYEDPLYFSKLFRKETGHSPSEYKNAALLARHGGTYSVPAFAPNDGRRPQND